MIKHLNSAQRSRLYDQLKRLQGEYCALCGGKGYKARGPDQLVIERKENSHGYAIDNCQLAHHRCNIRKDPRRLSKVNPKRALSVDDVDRKTVRSAELEKSMRAEPIFRRYVIGRIMKEDKVEVKELVNSGAEHCLQKGVTISQQTAGRYLDKITSSEGLLMIDDSTETSYVVARGSKAEESDAQFKEGEDVDSLADRTIDQK